VKTLRVKISEKDRERCRVWRRDVEGGFIEWGSILAGLTWRMEVYGLFKILLCGEEKDFDGEKEKTYQGVVQERDDCRPKSLVPLWNWTSV